MFEVILICIAVCADAFAAAYSYGLRGVKIKPLPAFTISLTGAAFLAAALTAAQAIGCLLSDKLCKTLSAAILILIAMKNLVDAQSVSHSTPDERRDTLSVKGSLILAAALSVDSLGVGFGAGVTMPVKYKLTAVGLCLLLRLVSVTAGHILGGAFSRKASRYKTALISSAILFVLAVNKLL